MTASTCYDSSNISDDDLNSDANDDDVESVAVVAVVAAAAAAVDASVEFAAAVADGEGQQPRRQLDACDDDCDDEMMTIADCLPIYYDRLIC